MTSLRLAPLALVALLLTACGGAQPAGQGYMIPTPAPPYGGYFHGHYYPHGCYRCAAYRRPGIIRRIIGGRTGYTYRATVYRYSPPAYRPYSPPAYRYRR